MMLQSHLPLAASCLVLGIALGSPSIAQFIPPPTIGKPGNRVGAGTRPGSCLAGTQQINLTALVPTGGMGLTTTPYPTVFWFMPANTAVAVRFTLYELDEHLADRAQRYQAVLQSNGEAGVASLTLPAQAGLPPLAVGKTYRWQVALICEAEDLAEAEEMPGANGWIRRLEAKPVLEPTLKTATLREQFRRYAQTGIWYDALTALAAARRAAPSQTQLVQDWSRLLRSEPVGLAAIAEQPLLHLQPLRTGVQPETP